MSYLPKFSSPIFTDTPKMYLAYTLTTLFAKFFLANSFYLYGLPNRQIFPVYSNLLHINILTLFPVGTKQCLYSWSSTISGRGALCSTKANISTSKTTRGWLCEHTVPDVMLLSLINMIGICSKHSLHLPSVD